MNRQSKILIGVLMLLSAFQWGGQLQARISGEIIYSNHPETQSIEKPHVSGFVTDDKGEPIAGAMVMIKGSTIGVMTDKDGFYDITLPEAGRGYVLIYSFIGMERQEVGVKGNTGLDISMVPDNELDAAVIDGGYGVMQRKENLTGSAFEVTGADLAKKPAARIDNLLTGLVPGLVVNENKTNGRTTVSIRIRGEGSLSASREPLWIVDGVPIYTGSNSGTVSGTQYSISPLSFLNPEDIESMTVLKDAATATLYGADGSNGVIFVKTKKGTSGKTAYSASIKYGVSAVDRSTTLKVLNAKQWWGVAEEAWTNAGKSMEIFPYQDNEYNDYTHTDTDWFKVVMGVGHNAQVNFSANGGTEKLRSYFSAGYYWERSPYVSSRQNNNRFNIRENLTIKFLDNFDLRVVIAGAFRDDDIASLYSFYDEILPIFSPYDNNGEYRLYNYYSRDDNDYAPKMVKFHANELPNLKYNDNNQKTISADIQATLSYRPFKGMELTSFTGFSTRNTYETIYKSGKTLEGLSDSGANGYSHRGAAFSYIFVENIRANFNRTFGNHSVSAMAGVEFKDDRYGSLYAYGKGFSNDYMKEIGYATDETKKGSSTASHQRKLGFMANASYSFDRRYTATFTFRADGNSAFSTYSKWGIYASGGLNWNIHNEHFFSNDIVHLFRAKISFGTSGNSKVDSSAAYGAYTVSTGAYYGGVAGATETSPSNPGLTWEKAYILNGGIDFGFFKRLEISLEAYRKVTDDMLYSGRVSSVISTGSVTRNVGKMSNIGMEISITSRNFVRQNFKWTTILNGSKNWNKVLRLYKDTYTGFFDTIWTEGSSKNAHWLVRWAGVDPTNGLPMWYTKDGNLTYTFNFSDRVLLPQYPNVPDFQGGMTNTFEIGPVTIGLNILYQFGGWTLCSDHIDDGYDIVNDNGPVEALNHWKQPGDISDSPRLLYKNSYSATNYSTRNLVKTTSIEIKNLSVTYDLPSKYAKKLKMNRLSVSVIADNLYLWTPGQSRHHNSYKTMKYSDGLTRTVSAEVLFGF